MADGKWIGDFYWEGDRVTKVRLQASERPDIDALRSTLTALGYELTDELLKEAYLCAVALKAQEAGITRAQLSEVARWPLAAEDE